jgi:predicted transcriptional regulator
MTATTLKLPAETKKQIAALANSRGVSAHKFMVEAVLEGVERARQELAFIADSEASLKHVLGGEPVYALAQVKQYIARKAKGGRAKRPRGAPWAK